jgi:phage gp37-like protein
MKRLRDLLVDGRPAAMKEASRVFRLAMPGLGDLPAIKEYITWVAIGIQHKLFTGREGSQMLYAAQTALSACQAERSQTDAGALHKTDRGSNRLVRKVRQANAASNR